MTTIQDYQVRTAEITRPANGTFPLTRMRRTRQSDALRRMVRETRLSIDNLVAPLFISEAISESQPISSMPGHYQLTLSDLPKEVESIAKLGIPAVLLFGIPSHKDEIGSEAYNPDGIIQKAIRIIKERIPEILVITDVCFCEYTSHGHCGVLIDGLVHNDKTLTLLVQEALSHVEAGADIIAPSDMMDGRVAAIRQALDLKGYESTPIMAYSAKYSSGFYSPFRDAAESAPQFGDRRGYQMDPANGREALREVELDISEGADIVMVKPALPYLDIITKVRERYDIPVAAYNVSGEFAMVKAAALNGWIDEKRITMEILTGIKRAGADIIITYHAKDAAEWVKQG